MVIQENKNRFRFGIAIVLLFLLSAFRSGAEILPASGSFEGTYHQDRWGVGHFEFFLVAPELLPRLKPYDGKPVRLTVTKGKQPVNPGPAIMQEVAAITPLAESILDATIATVPAAVSPQEPFQLVCFLKNRGAEPLSINGGNVVIQIRSHAPGADAMQPSWFIKEYTQGQLSTQSDQVQLDSSLVKTASRFYGNLRGGAAATIEPGDAFPVAVLFDHGLAPGEYEFAVTVRGLPADQRKQGESRESVTVKKWVSYDVAAVAATIVVHPSRLVLRNPSFEVGAGNYRLKGSIAPAAGQNVRMVRQVAKEKSCWVGRVRATTATGEDIVLGRISQADLSEPARLIPVPAEGLPLELNFSKDTYFSTQAVQKVYLDLLTEHGMETLAVTESFAGDVLPPVTPFGAEADGVKLRIRPASETIRAGEPLKLCWQFVNVSGKPVTWLQTGSGDGRLNVVEIDGKVVRAVGPESPFGSGWAGAWTCAEPKEHLTEIPAAAFQGVPGRHTVRVVVLPQRGFYKNSNNQQIPYLRKRLISNTADFTIQQPQRKPAAGGELKASTVGAERNRQDT